MSYKDSFFVIFQHQTGNKYRSNHITFRFSLSMFRVVLSKICFKIIVFMVVVFLREVVIGYCMLSPKFVIYGDVFFLVKNQRLWASKGEKDSPSAFVLATLTSSNSQVSTPHFIRDKFESH